MPLPDVQFQELKRRLIAKKQSSQPIQSSSDIISRIEKEFGQRTEELSGEFTKPITPVGVAETGLRTAGQTAGFISDILGETGKSALKFLGKFVPTPVQKGAEKILGTALQNPIVHEGIEAIGKGVNAYKEWKTKNPELAKDLEAVGNISFLLPIERGAKMGEEVVEAGIPSAVKLAEKTAGILEEKALNQKTRETLDVIMPTGETLTKTERAEALASGRATSEGITPLKKVVLKPTKNDLKIAQSVENIVSPRKNAAENIASIRGAIKKEATTLMSELELETSIKTIFNEKTLRNNLEQAKEESRVIFGSDKTLENNYDAIIDEFMKHVKKYPKTVAGLQKARKDFDRIIEQKFPKVFETIGGDNVRSNAILDVRRQANKFTEDLLPENHPFKSRLQKQNKMYDAIKMISEKNQSIIDQGVLHRIANFFERRPGITIGVGTILTGEAIGVYGRGLVEIVESPLAIAVLLTTGSLWVGKKLITAREVKTGLAHILRISANLMTDTERSAFENLILRLPAQAVGASAVATGRESFNK